MADKGDDTQQTMDMESDSGFADQSSTTSTVDSLISDTETLQGDPGDAPGVPGEPHTDPHGMTSEVPLQTGQWSSSSVPGQGPQTAVPGQPPVFPGRYGQDRSTDSGYSSVRPGQQERTDPFDIRPPGATTDSHSRTEEWVEKHFDLFVKDCNGTNHTIQVTDETSVEQLRKKVAQKAGIPTEQQVLNYGGRVMQDGQRMKAYGIQPRSTVYCTGRLRGGKQGLKAFYRTTLTSYY